MAPSRIAAAADYGRHLRPILRARLKAAREIAIAKGLVIDANQCSDKLRELRRTYDNEVPMHVAGIDQMIDTIKRSQTWAQWRAGRLSQREAA